MRTWMLLVVLCAACGDDKAPNKDAAAPPGAPTTIASPRGGTMRDLATVTLTSDQPSTIYYTTDGTDPSMASTNGPSPVSITSLTTGGTLKFFGQSDGGPAETAKTEIYIIDRLGPIAIDGFSATANGADVDLAWTNPTAAGFTDVVVARTPDVAATVPADATALAVGDMVGPGKVIFAGSAATFKDVAPGFGGFAYVAWARYSNTVYAEGRTASAFLEPAAQVGQISIDTTAGTATVSTQPSAWTLAIANYAVDPADATKISFDVNATSTLHGVTFMPKLVQTGLTATNAATVTLTADGTLTADASNVVLLGSAVGAAGTLTRKVSMVVSAASTVTFDFTVRHDRARIYPSWTGAANVQVGGMIGDLVSTVSMPALPIADRFVPGNKGANQNGQYRDVVVSADGRWVFAGQRSAAHIVKIDTTTGLVVAGADLGNATTRGSVQIALDPSGHRLYATFNDGMHIGADRADATTLHAPLPTTNTAYLVELDTATMTEQKRLPLTSATDPQHVARAPHLSRDGRLATFPIGAPYTTADTTEIAVVDLSKLALRDADPNTAGQQNVAAGTERPTRCGFTWTADRVICTSSESGNLGDHVLIIDATALTMTVADEDGAPATNTASFKLSVARPDGKLWVLGNGIGLVELDPMMATFRVVQATALATTALAAMLSADGSSLLVTSYRSTDQIATADGTVTHLAGSPTAEYFYGHTIAMTPF